jgi:hypothetical protein
MKDYPKDLAENLAREVDRRRFLRILADAAFVGFAWIALDWRNAPTALGSHTACSATSGICTCTPPGGRLCGGGQCSGADCAGGCTPSDCGGWSESSHFCWCTAICCAGQGGATMTGYYVCCDCMCAQCCLCSTHVSTGGCLGKDAGKRVAA